ncbi:S-adenosyl-L-methionine-dependent methyltransferase [Auricularia subglabra TFB-10046 SS5]|nr:S-adenosyl-L-methionine-dependent methyltransferase [Auricularia subglabra TFB-10046 SS5]
MAAAASTVAESNKRFDADATKWDSKPEVVESSARCHSHLLSRSDLLPHNQLARSLVLELGCGTGLLSVALAPHVRHIWALDTSEGMIAMLEAKVEAQQLQGKVVPRVKLLDDPNDPVLEGNAFDLVVSHLVFHHIPDMQHMVNVLHGCCKPDGGRIWVSDFEDDGPQAENFHRKTIHNTIERHGLKRGEMKDILVRAGFQEVDVFESFRMDKAIDSGDKQNFPFIVATGVRKG